MRKFFIFAFTTILLGFSGYGQRAGYQASKLIDLPANLQGKSMISDTLLPGNWETATGAAVYSWEDDKGYIFGTNLYGDKAYAQRFDVEEPHEIVKAIFWIGEKFGSTGDVVFSVWDFNGMYPGNLLGSVTVSMEEITASDDISGALVVAFDEPVFVTGSYLIGADISGLEAFEPEVYGLGHFSSTDDNGTGLGYAYVLEGTMWVPVLNYDVDVDIAIFPVVNYVETHVVTLNVDMTGLEEFDPDSNVVYVTGNFNKFIEPGAEGSFEMTMVPRENEEDPLIYTYTLPFVRVGEMLYKYYSDAVGEGWEGGEWEGEPNRYLFVQEDLVTNDIWAEPSVDIDEPIVVDQGIRVFPNPVRTTLNIQSGQTIDHIRLYDLTGQLVFEKRVVASETSVDTGMLRSGIYILQLISGQQLRNHKIQVIK